MLIYLLLYNINIALLHILYISDISISVASGLWKQEYALLSKELSNLYIVQQINNYVFCIYYKTNTYLLQFIKKTSLYFITLYRIYIVDI